MKKTYLLLALLSLPVVAFGSPLNNEKPHQCKHHNNLPADLDKLDTTKYCMYNNSFYTKGAIVDQAGLKMECSKNKYNNSDHLEWNRIN